LYGNGFPIRNQDLLRKIAPDARMRNMPHHDARAGEIRSQSRGPHWIAWCADATGKPAGAIVFVGETREEAEARATQWREENPEQRGT
jgi:hypothetical protein